MEKSFEKVLFKQPIITWLKSHRFSDIIGYYSDSEFVEKSAMFKVDIEDNKVLRMHVGAFEKLGSLVPESQCEYEKTLKKVIDKTVLFTNRDTVSVFLNRQVLLNRYRQEEYWDEIELECLVNAHFDWIHCNYMLYKSEKSGHICAYILILNISDFHNEKDKVLSSLSQEINPLTSLPNMIYFRELAPNVVAENTMNGEKTVFVHFDVDNFKSYNANYGFQKGDQLLRYIAVALQENFSENLVAHFGQDHFAVVTTGCSVLRKIENLRSFLDAYPKGDIIEIKAGIYEVQDDELDVSVACDRAKIACDSIKRKYNENFRYFDEELIETLGKQKYIIDNIDNAIYDGDIKVYYQPVFSTKTGKLVSFEALSRWNDSKYGFLSPNDYIDVLEKHRLIHKIDIFSLENICKDIRMLIDNDLPYVPVSLNLSRLDFELCDIVEIVDANLKKYNISKELLHIEITESVLTDNQKDFKNQIEFFQSKGYEVWMDDFGSGYSSLNVLKDFNFDVLKIDMLFLRDFEINPKAKEIVASIVEMGKKLGIDTLAEGVETKEQYEFLKRIGCGKVQGYYFGKPQPLDDTLIAFMKENVEDAEKKQENLKNIRSDSRKKLAKLASSTTDRVFKNAAQSLTNGVIDFSGMPADELTGLRAERSKNYIMQLARESGCSDGIALI